jgi:hypothetical protein
MYIKYKKLSFPRILSHQLQHLSSYKMFIMYKYDGTKSELWHSLWYNAQICFKRLTSLDFTQFRLTYIYIYISKIMNMIRLNGIKISKEQEITHSRRLMTKVCLQHQMMIYGEQLWG